MTMTASQFLLMILSLRSHLVIGSYPTRKRPLYVNLTRPSVHTEQEYGILEQRGLEHCALVLVRSFAVLFFVDDKIIQKTTKIYLDTTNNYINMTHSIRKVSYSSSRVGLQLPQVEELLCKTLPSISRDKDLCRYVRRNYSGLSKCRRGLSRNEIQEIIVLLKTVLDTSRTVSPSILANIHSTIGLLCQVQRHTNLAIHSFTISLWIQSKQGSNQIDIALSIHRIALCHSSLGHFDVATFLLKRALDLYSESRLCKRHPFMIHAKEELEHVEETQRLSHRAHAWCENKKAPPRREKTSPPASVQKLTSTKLLLVACSRIEVEIGWKVQEQKNTRKNNWASMSSLSSSIKRVTTSQCFDSCTSSNEFSSSHALAA